jgi:redox-sensing transcriptional repressor
VIGFGNLGRALSFYKGFRDQGIFIKVAFDINKKEVNRNYAGLRVYPLNRMEDAIRRENIHLGIVTVPREAASDIIMRLYACGLRAILNFAPIKPSLPKDAILKDVDFSCQLAYLTYRLKLLEKKV